MPDTLSTDAPNRVITDEGLLYLRMPSGEIVSADAQDSEIMKKVRRGWTPLFEYGQFGSSAYYMDHPYEALFQAGGARELPVEQVVSLGYHLRPPLVPTCDRHVATEGHVSHTGNPQGRNAREQGCWMGARPVHFPQLDEQDIPAAPDACEHCGRDDFPTEQALRQHQGVMHSDHRQQIELADGIVAGLVRSGSLPAGASSTAAEIAAAVVLALRQLEQPQPRRRNAHGQFSPTTDDEDEDN